MERLMTASRQDALPVGGDAVMSVSFVEAIMTFLQTLARIPTREPGI